MDFVNRAESARCSFCPKETEAKYTCPRCNASYCSTTCYQSQRHSGCSESFYKECVTDEIRSSERNPEDKKKMLEMLRRLEDGYVDDGLDSDDCESCPALSERLEGINLEDTDLVWAQLNDVEKAEFEKMVETGEIRKLIPSWKPWWHTTKTKLVKEVDKAEDEGDSVPAVKTDVPPLSQIMKKAPNRVVKYAVVNALYSYVYMMRLHNGDPESQLDSWVDGLLRMSGALRGQNYDDTMMAMSSCTHTLLQMPDMMEKKLQTETERDVLNLVCSQHLVAAALSHTHALLKTSKSFYKKQEKGSSDFSVGSVRSAMKKIEFFLSWLQEHFKELRGLT